MSEVLIIGGHGKVALLAERLLAGAGHRVVGVIRNPDHADDVRAAGAEPLVSDVESLDVAGLTELVAGYDAVVWSAGAGGGNPARTYAVDRDAAIRTVDAVGAAAADGGTPARLVMVSYFGAGPDHGVAPENAFFPYAEAKSEADAYIEASAVPWTILRPSRLTDGAPGGVSTTDRNPGEVPRATVAEVIAAVVDHPASTDRRIITFNQGPEPVADVVAGA
ncbi:SDR family oxidoreductase [Nocardioides sp. GXZ039]|uniref:SDR family oxidoreductase n=1 Tax=Nocardioides sp. GXZ039 TaxID=3136018 RepID=UPI0030F3B3F5